MVTWRRRLVPAIAAALLLGMVTNAVSDAEEAVLIPGATVFKRINPLYPILAETYPDIGIHFRNDPDAQVVDYSQNALAADKAILDGVVQANVAVHAVDGKVVVIGESMGSMVASRLAVELANSPAAPSTDNIRFVLIAPPEAGAAEYFKVGTYIPILNYRVSRIAESRYPTTIVIGEYDFWADPPDRPWNVVALANALMGIVYVHGPPIFTADPADVPPQNTTVRTNSQGGTVTTLLVPTKNLPLTQPLRDVGIPDEVVDQIDQVLRPVVDAGYVRHDKPGDTRPYLSEGQIRHHVQSQQQVRERLPEPRDGTREDPQGLRKNHTEQPHKNGSEQRQASHVDRLEHRGARLPAVSAESKAEPEKRRSRSVAAG